MPELGKRRPQSCRPTDSNDGDAGSGWIVPPTIDEADLSILRILHEFEYDPCPSASKRISPVPLYLIYAALWPISKARPVHESPAHLKANVHARVEGLRALGYLRSAKRNWPNFSGRSMRDGRLICVDRVLGQHRLRVDGGEDVAQRFWEFSVYFDHKDHVWNMVNEARTKHPKASDFSTVQAVLEENFKRLTWRYYDEAAHLEWLRRLGYSNAPRPQLPDYGLCYALKAKGIECVRSSERRTGMGPTRRTKAGGRPPVLKSEARKRERLVDRWKQARAAGVLQKDFIEGENVTLAYLTKCINWVAQRRRRSTGS